MLTRRTLLGSLPVTAAVAAMKSPLAATEAVAATEAGQPERPWSELDWGEPLPPDMLEHLPTLKRLHNPGLVSLGIAIRFGMKTKPELMAIVRQAMEGDDGGKWLPDVMETLEEAAKDFEMYTAFMNAGYARMFVAIATVCEEDDKAVAS
ncbi:hypothetical protein ACSBOB_22035 [Mesorhizobium sp. ASY16-5R]|uniref:hypothetical protein n=1 Tax=Mesorhizobium sp. ASY16-5R TaxID=3445772 RepID=UPI003F9EEA14